MNQDIKDIKLPTTVKEFAQWLRDVAEQVDRIPDRPISMREDDIEIGFYYGNPMFPQMPTGLHFSIDGVTTEFYNREQAAAIAKFYTVDDKNQ